MDNTVSQKQKRVNEAARAISEMASGTTLTHIAMAEILGERPKTQGYYSMVNRVKRELMQGHSVFLATEIGVGYKIAEPGTEIDVPDAKCKRATNQYVRAVKEMQHIDIDRIKDDCQKQRTIRIAQDRANLIGLMKLGGGGGKQTASVTG